MKFLDFGSSEMARKIVEFDWSRTSAGPLEHWPQILRNQVSTILATLFPSILLWGTDFTVCAYNDAYRQLLGNKPEPLGRSFLKVWQEAEEIIKPQLEQAVQGEACYHKDAPFTLLRFDKPSRAYFDYCFSPIRDETGSIVGVLNTAMETTERCQANEIIRKNERQLREAYRIARIGDWEWNLRTGEVHWSSEIYSMHGMSPDVPTLTPDTLVKQVHPEDLDMVNASISKAVSEGTPADLTYRVILPDNSIRVIHAMGKVTKFDADGIPLTMIGTNHDITDRKKIEDELKESEVRANEEKERLTCLLNSICDEVWFADIHGQFTLANPSAVREFNLSQSDCCDVVKLAESLEVYRADGSLRPIEETPPLRALTGETIRNQEEIIRTPSTGSLRYRQVSSAPVIDSKGHVIGSVSVVRDITDIKSAEKALQESENKFKSLAENNPDYIMRYDRQCKFAYLNPSALTCFGLSETDIIGKAYHKSDFFNIFNALKKDKIRQVFATAVPQFLEFTCNQSQRTVFIEGRLVPEFDYQGKVISVLGIFKNITDKKFTEIENKRLNSMLIQSQQDEIFEKNKKLEKLNVALEVILEKRNEQIRHIRADLINHFNMLVRPYIEDMKKIHNINM